MTCQNCGSNDIIEIQGQHYCINCGQQVVVAKPEPPAPPPEIVEAVKSTPLKLVNTTVDKTAFATEAKVKPKPLAEATNDPQVTPVSVISRHKTQLIRPISKTAKPISKTMDPTSEVAIKVAAPVKEVVALPPDAASEPLGLPRPKTARNVIDLKSIETTANPATETVVSSKPAPIVISSSVTQTDLKPVTKSRTSRHFNFNADHPGRMAWHMLSTQFWPLVLLYSVSAAFLNLILHISLTDNIVHILLSHGSLSSLPEVSLRYNLFAVLIAIGCAAVLYIFQTFISGKVIYGMSKQFDGRSASAVQSRQAGLGAFWGLIGLDLMFALYVASLIVLEALLIRYVDLVAGGTAMAQPVLLTLGNIVIIYTAIGLLCARILAARLIVLTGTKSSLALRTCWSIYAKQFGDLVVWGILAVAVSFLLSIPVGVFARGLTNITNITPLLRLAAITAVGSFSVYLILVFNLGFWTAIYHDLADRLEPEQRRFYLSGRQPKYKPKALQGIVFTLVIIAGLGVAGWVWRDQLASWLIPIIQNQV